MAGKAEEGQSGKNRVVLGGREGSDRVDRIANLRRIEGRGRENGEKTSEL